MKYRRALLLETLTLANPEKIDHLEKSLIGRQQLSREQTADLDHYIAAYKNMDRSSLVQRAEELVKIFDNSIIFYGAGFNLKEERDNYSYEDATSLFMYRDNIFGSLLGENVLSHLLDFDINLLAREGFHNLRSVLHLMSAFLNGDPSSDDSYMMNDMHKTYLPEILEDFKDKHNFEKPDEFLVYFLRQYCARAEYFLWETANTYSIKEWFEKLSNGRLSRNDPLVKFIQDVLGENSYTYKAIFGDVN